MAEVKKSGESRESAGEALDTRRESSTVSVLR
jgi:hypothetical protein